MTARTRVPVRSVLTARPSLPRAVLVLLVGMLMGAVTPSVAGAQDSNSLQSIIPADGASLSESPAEIQLVFNQEVAAEEIVTIVLTCNNQPVSIPLAELDDDRLIATSEIATPLPRGACVIAWSLTNADGEIALSNNSTFAVTVDPPPTESTGDATSPGTTDPFLREPAAGETAAPAAPVDTIDQGSTGGALWLGRMLSTLGILVVFGGLVLIGVGWPEGPEYVVTVRFLRFAWALSLLGTILFVVAFTADATGTSLGAAASPGSWLDLNDAGWAGRGALLRLVFVAATGWIAMRPERILDPTSAMWAWALPGFALVTVALGRVSGPAAPIGFIVGVAHVFAVAIWFGGAALVARVVLAGPGEDDLIQATRTFSRISIPAILVSCVTGIIQMIRLDGGDLFGSSHGRVLLLKAVAVAAMLAVALAARQQVTQRLDRAHELTVSSADRFRRAFGAEAALGVVALAFSGWLLGLDPSRTNSFPSFETARVVPFMDGVTGLDVTVSISPAQVGTNGLLVEVDAPPDGITNLVVDFVPPEGSQQNTISQPINLRTAGTAYLPIEQGIPLRVAGTWQIKLSGSTAEGVLDEATFTFEVFEANGERVTVTPVPGASTPPVVSLIDQSTTTAPFATTTTLPPVTSTSAPSG